MTAAGEQWSAAAPRLGRSVRAEPTSVREIYDEHFDFMWRSARRLGVPDGALDDVIQDVLIVVHRRLPTFEGRSSLRTWLYGILLRVAREHRRSLGRKSLHVALGGATNLEQLEHPAPSPEVVCSEREAANILHALLDDLDEDKREAFVLVELEGFTVPEVAEMSGVNINTLYKRVRTARETFEAGLTRFRACEAARLR